jgi:hypothetical protein
VPGLVGGVDAAVFFADPQPATRTPTMVTPMRIVRLRFIANLPRVWNKCWMGAPAAARAGRLLDVGPATEEGIATKDGLRHCSKCITLGVKPQTHL